MSKIKSGLATLISSNVESKSMELLTSFLCPRPLHAVGCEQILARCAVEAEAKG